MQGAVAAGVDRGEFVGQPVEGVQGGAGELVHAAGHGVLGDRGGRRGQVAVAVVGPVHAQHLEARRQRLDLAQEVGGGEAALAELVRQRVGGRGQLHAAVGQPGEQRGDQDGVAGVVELELVDADQREVGQPLHRGGEAEGADQAGVLDERAVGLLLARRRGLVPERGQQVGLADAEAAVEVDADRAGDRSLPLEQPAALLRSGGADGRGEGLEPVARSGLAGLCGVRDSSWRTAPGRTAAAGPGLRSAGPRPRPDDARRGSRRARRRAEQTSALFQSRRPEGVYRTIRGV